MIRSLDYAVQSVLLGVTDDRGRPPGMIRDEDRPAVEPWAFSWYDHVTREFLSAYYTAIGPAGSAAGDGCGLLQFSGAHAARKSVPRDRRRADRSPGLASDPVAWCHSLAGQRPGGPGFAAMNSMLILCSRNVRNDRVCEDDSSSHGGSGGGDERPDLMDRLPEIASEVKQSGAILLGLDLDGTLAQIRPRPEEVVVRRRPIREMLAPIVEGRAPDM